MSKQLPKLYVEGDDDIVVISALLDRHGCDTKRGKAFLSIEQKGSDTALVESMGENAKLSTALPIGFVLDIDIECEPRWHTVRNQLSRLPLELPDLCPPNGYIGTNAEYKQKVGVWLMPDCRSDGQKLENLLHSLIPQNDILWPKVVECTAEANRILRDEQTLRKAIADKDIIKAEVNTWLAWQEHPGESFGTAIRNKYFTHDSPQALAFLKWLKDLYDLPITL
jgi:hypothetical protein